MKLLPFQNRFTKKALSPGVKIAALSLARGNGKSFLAGRIAADAMKGLQRGEEIALVAGSVEQGRIVFRFVRRELGEDGFRYTDTAQRCAIAGPNNTRLRVYGANGKTLMGLVNTPLVVADEPGAWEISGGELVWDAISTAMGKPESPLRCVMIGTLAPFAVEGHWWHSLATGEASPHVHSVCFQGNPEKWDDWREIARCNPLVRISKDFREQLKIEREEARNDERLKARFLSYRLNVPSGDASKVLLEVEQWKKALARETPPRQSRPIVAIDLGSGRAWSAAVAFWENGRAEALALAPGIPDISAQEKRDRVPGGRYRTLVESGQLRIAEGLHVPPPSLLWDFIIEAWGIPAHVVCDRFRVSELKDAIGNAASIEARVSQWSESSHDIRALRKMVSDGPLSVAEGRELLSASLAVAATKTDQSGNVRLVKKNNNTARDDVAAALILAAGAHARMAARPRRPRRVALAG